MTDEATTITDYREALILQLRLKDVPGERIGELVAEVESHVADTGEHPAEAFGSPRAYASSLVDERDRDPWWSTGLTVVAAAVAGWFVAQGVLALLLGESYLGRPGWLWIGVGLLVGVPAAVRVQRRSSAVRDPRDGSDMVPTSRWGVAVLVGLPVAIVVVAWAVISLLAR